MRRLTYPGLGVSLILLLAGCATNSARRQLEAFPLLMPAAFEAEVERTQRLTIGPSTGAAALTVDAAVEVDAQQVRVAGMLSGQRILLLVWDGRQLQEVREPVLPKSLQGRAILRDMQLVYWPAKAIRAVLSPGWRLEEMADRRQLFYRSSVVLESERRDTTPLGGAWVRNHVGHYQITIEVADESR